MARDEVGTLETRCAEKDRLYHTEEGKRDLVLGRGVREGWGRASFFAPVQ